MTRHLKLDDLPHITRFLAGALTRASRGQADPREPRNSGSPAAGGRGILPSRESHATKQDKHNADDSQIV